MSTRPTGCGEDVAAYALGALEPEHARAFERHMRGCELCTADLAALRPAVDLLPASAERVEPPAELKRRIMAVVEAEAKERHRGEQAVRRPRRFGLRTFAPVAAGLAAAAIAVVMLVGGDDGETASLRAKVKPPGSDVELRMEGQRGTLVVQGMPTPRGERVYQVWKKRGAAAPEPTDALFTPTRDGDASVAVPGDMKGVDQVLVSAEPPGGSRRPTTAAAIVVET